MKNFNKILGILIGLLIIFFTFNQNAFAIIDNEPTKKILVLSDRVEQANVKYFIYPQVSEIVATDTINRLNSDKGVKALQLSDVKTELKKTELIRSSTLLLNNYRYTYDINYAALKKIAKAFGVTNVLLITGSLDTTSDFLKPTWWAFLNIPGENVVKTEFKMYTYAALVNLDKEIVTWQNSYERKLVAPEFGLADLNYSPDSKQIIKVKQGSQLIAKDIAYRVESVLTPLIAAEKIPPTIHEFVKLKINKTYEESIQNINELKTKTAEKIKKINTPDIDETEANIEPAIQKTTKTSIETKIKPENNENESEKNTILNFVNSKKDQNKEQEELNKKINQIIKEKAIQTKPLNTTETLELRPAIDIEKNIKINPINIIIPKM